ncbi:MAG TPA: hypothetical protein VHZ81_11765 [Galbitalea sp.]|jgi:hypothetical protein|nr:hypothetical protein [Galbitalea sp.]
MTDPYEVPRVTLGEQFRLYICLVDEEMRRSIVYGDKLSRLQPDDDELERKYGDLLPRQVRRMLHNIDGAPSGDTVPIRLRASVSHIDSRRSDVFDTNDRYTSGGERGSFDTGLITLVRGFLAAD